MSRTCSVCEKTQTEDIVNYRWELNADKNGLVSVTTDGNLENAMTTVKGSMTSGGVFKMENAFTLEADKEWVMEWKAKGNDE